MQFRRIDELPPYVFATVDELKRRLRHEGRDVIDLGFGNPDIPSPPLVVDKLAEAAAKPANHRYSASRGIPRLREAVAELYERRFGVHVDPEHAGRRHDRRQGRARAPDVGAARAGRRGRRADAELSDPPRRAATRRRNGRRAQWRSVDGIEEAVALATPAPRVLIISFPHNPTTATATPELMQRLVDLARERELVIVHDFAYADIAFDGHVPPSILQADGADECAVELYSLTKSFSMAGWRVGFVVGRADVVQALAKLKSYLDYGTFQPIQIASIVALRDTADYPVEVCEIYRSRRDALCTGLARAGWNVEPPRGTMFVWAPIPERVPSRGLARVRAPARAGRERGGQPGHRLRRGRRRTRPLRARRERAADRAGDAARSASCCPARTVVM